MFHLLSSRHGKDVYFNTNNFLPRKHYTVIIIILFQQRLKHGLRVQRFQIGWVLMTEPVTAKREQVSKKDDKEDNASVQEIMVRSNNMSFPSPFWTFGDYITRKWNIFDFAGGRRRICDTQGIPHEEGVLYALGFKVGTSWKFESFRVERFFLFFVKCSSSGSAPTWSPCQWLASTKHLARASSQTTTSYRLSARLVAFSTLFKCFESVQHIFLSP